MHKASLELMKQGFMDKYLNPDKAVRVLDIGSYNVNGTYKNLFINPKWGYTGMDVCAGPNVDIVGWDNLQERSKIFHWNVIISGQTMEHVKRPWEFMQNIASICDPQTLICIIVPHTQNQHNYPIDCYRFFPEGLKALFEYAKLDVLECYKSKIAHRGNPIDTICIGIKE